MACAILDGKLLSKTIRAGLKTRADTLKLKGMVPGLAVVLVGEDPASAIYVRNKERGCKEAGIASFAHRLPAGTTQTELEALIATLNADPTVHGILVQLPLPKHLDETRILAAIDPKKDVDGFSVSSMGALAQGLPGFIPCTPKGCMALIAQSGIHLSGKNAVVVGRSNIVGKPMALLLLQESATVTICHSRTVNLAAVTREADVLVAAVGKPYMITKDMIKPGAVVIDVGINRLEDGRVVGDVDTEAAMDVAGYITPVPGGVGPMTIAMLLQNTLDAAERVQCR